MSKLTARWTLEGGYSELLTESRILLRYQSGPVWAQLDQNPWKLLREGEALETEFRVARPIRGEASGFSWKVNPSSRIRARFLRPGNAFLGNHRVPEGQFGVQWSVDGIVQGGAHRRVKALIIEAEAGTRTSHIWVQLFRDSESALSALEAAWKAFRNPLDDSSVLTLEPDHLVNWSWIGSLNLEVDCEVALGQGWEISFSPKPWAEVLGQLDVSRGLTVRASYGIRGEWTLRVSRRSGQYSISFLKKRRSLIEGGLSVGVGLKGRVRTTSQVAPVRSLMMPLNRELADAVSRKLEVTAWVDLQRLSQSTVVVRLQWPEGNTSLLRPSLKLQVSRLLSGRIPEPVNGVRMSWRLEGLKRTTQTVALNLLDWISLGRSKSKETHWTISRTPRGNLVLERGVKLEQQRFRWDRIQLMRFLYDQRQGSARKDGALWSSELNGVFSQSELTSIVKSALRSRSIRAAEIPETDRFPADLRIVWLTRFTHTGLEAVRQSSSEVLLSALVAALEVLYPDRYGRGAFWRDWVDREEVRQVIDQNPAQAHLQSVYPFPGRTLPQRRAVVTEYRRVKTFLDLCTRWREGGNPDLVRLIERRMELPVFLVFQILCSESQKESLIWISGDFEAIWGAKHLLESFVSK